VGYNEDGSCDKCKRTGSHNIVLGTNNDYRGIGGIVGGDQNSVTAPYAVALTGRGNHAVVDFSFVATGEGNTADGLFAATLGGVLNTAKADYSAIIGGLENSANGTYIHRLVAWVNSPTLLVGPPVSLARFICPHPLAISTRLLAFR